MPHDAIKVQGLSKDYLIGGAGPGHSGSLYGALERMLKAPFAGNAAGTGNPSSFSALRDVSFEIPQGEVTGVIGRNGAGKSTLLKILSRITSPTTGRVEVRGRLASLLEVGTGFHPELSGRENVFLNGAILGMTRSEVTRKFDEIIDFAEVEKFVDTPVKHYSSGMYVRLAFAVAAHLETDILLVDEVLAVGDASFQRKSMGKMGDVAKRGRTVLFVSHNLGAVRNLCTRALLFERGSLAFDGAVQEGLNRYERSFSNAGGHIADTPFQGSLVDSIRFERIVFTQEGKAVNVIDPLREFRIEVHGASSTAYASVELKLCFFQDGLLVTSCYDTEPGTPMRDGPFASSFRIPADVFRPGRYTLGLGATASTGTWAWGADVAALDFSENRGNRPGDSRPGVVTIPYSASRTQ
ncbi:MAG TPA: ABC transporter ATP-binding protein [Ramlibacter sp.]|nr:ABC transporter ATP-binding protein [Ramlibacter sp.]